MRNWLTWTAQEVANRYRGRTMQNQVWPNIIIYFPIEYYVNIAYTSHGVTKHYEDDWLNARIKDLQVTYDTADRDDIARGHRQLHVRQPCVRCRCSGSPTPSR